MPSLTDPVWEYVLGEEPFEEECLKHRTRIFLCCKRDLPLYDEGEESMIDVLLHDASNIYDHPKSDHSGKKKNGLLCLQKKKKDDVSQEAGENRTQFPWRKKKEPASDDERLDYFGYVTGTFALHDIDEESCALNRGIFSGRTSDEPESATKIRPCRKKDDASQEAGENIKRFSWRKKKESASDDERLDLFGYVPGIFVENDTEEVREIATTEGKDENRKLCSKKESVRSVRVVPPEKMVCLRTDKSLLGGAPLGKSLSFRRNKPFGRRTRGNDNFKEQREDFPKACSNKRTGSNDMDVLDTRTTLVERKKDYGLKNKQTEMNDDNDGEDTLELFFNILFMRDVGPKVDQKLCIVTPNRGHIFRKNRPALLKIFGSSSSRASRNQLALFPYE